MTTTAPRSASDVALSVLGALDRDPADERGWARTALLLADDPAAVGLVLARAAHVLSGALDVATLGEAGWDSPKAPEVLRLLLDNQSTLVARG